MVNLGRSTLEHLDGYRYQRIVKRNIKYKNIKHLISQELGYLLKNIPQARTIINCHDLIPWVYDQQRSRRWKHNLEGMGKASKIITVSQFSKDEIISHLNFPEEDVHIIPDAVDHSRYHPQVEVSERTKWGGSDEDRYLLYVGSETPRMNLKVLLEALAKLKNLIPGVKLLKIGEPQGYGAREVLLKQIVDLKIENDVIFLGYVSEEELPGFYRAAEVLVYPCLYAGFGLPPLEAMACGTPVITSNTTSLPEVVGNAGLMFNPHRGDELVTKLYEVLAYQKLREKMIRRGVEHSRKFSWDEAAEKTRDLYRLVEDGG
jgi:glycosyltransferase involved in cell wall biosynthesis